MKSHYHLGGGGINSSLILKAIFIAYLANLQHVSLISIMNFMQNMLYL